jgi:hypothetical protein
MQSLFLGAKTNRAKYGVFTKFVPVVETGPLEVAQSPTIEAVRECHVIRHQSFDV